MLPESEIQDLIESLERANVLIDEQESRIEFLSDAGEDVAEFKGNLAKAKEKRNKLMRALNKQIEIVKSSKSRTTSSHRGQDKRRDGKDIIISDSKGL